jgi:predicted MFS family arabinose efflux permease
MALVARLFSGYIVDSFPRKTVLLLSFAVFTLFFVGYVAAGTLVLFAVVRTVHGMPFGFTTVANSTVAIDVLPSSRRTEGIGLYGLSNNLASAISPMVAIWIYTETHNFDIIFWMATVVAAIGLIIDGTVKTRPRERVKGKQKVSLDRFFLVKGTGAALTMVCFAFSYGVMSTYVAIYGKETLGIEGGSGTFFLLLSVGLILSRLQGNKALRERRITYNASIGVCVSLLGYLLFAAVPNEIGYYGAALIIGLGNGHMYPAYQNMFVDLAPHTQRGTANSSILVSWDVGVGLGILLGGVLTENYGYGMAFWMAWVVNLVGFAGFWLYVKGHFTRNKLR